MPHNQFDANTREAIRSGLIPRLTSETKVRVIEFFNTEAGSELLSALAISIATGPLRGEAFEGARAVLRTLEVYARPEAPERKQAFQPGQYPSLDDDSAWTGH